MELVFHTTCYLRDLEAWPALHILKCGYRMSPALLETAYLAQCWVDRNRDCTAAVWRCLIWGGQQVT